MVAEFDGVRARFPLPLFEMDEELMKYVRTYRLTAGLPERRRLGGKIAEKIGLKIHMFVFNRISDRYADDVYQNAMIGIATSLKNFRGSTEKEFWAWCYRIARNKLNDQYRSQAKDPEIVVAPEEMREMIESVSKDSPEQVRHDLDYVMSILEKSKPDCRSLLWDHFVTGHDYTELGEFFNASYDAIRVRIARCLETAKSLLN